MDNILDTLDLEIRIATTTAVRAQLEAAMLRSDRAGITYLNEERRLRALVDELIALRARQIDEMWPDQARRQA
jgi:hypothetical protein